MALSSLAVVERIDMFRQAELQQILQTIPWFLELNETQLEKLASIATIRHLVKDEILFREGDPEGNLFILLEGEMVLDIQIPGRDNVRIFTAEPLDIIGWSSLTPMVRQRTATARAQADCNCLEINSEALSLLCDDDEKLGYIIMKRISNIVASRLLTTRIQLIDQLIHAD
jgi:CRP-like cAMP-binding protein